MLAALVLLMAAKIAVVLTIYGLSMLITRLGLVLLLIAFALLLAIVFFEALNIIIKQCVVYFSTQQRTYRKLLFMQSKKTQIEQLFYFKTLQMSYFAEVRRKQLLNANNREHIRQLSKTIDRELHLLKQQLPATDFKQLQEENSRYRNCQDSSGLLALQQKITALR